MQASDFLKAVIEQIKSNPQRLSVGATARDDKNEAHDILGDGVHSFSMLGWVDRASAEGLITSDEANRVYDQYATIARNEYGKSISELNDTADIQTVLAVMERVARNLEP